MSAAPLLDFHQRQPAASAISDEVIAARGYGSVGRPTAGDHSGQRAARRCQISSKVAKDDARYPGLLIPLYRATGELIGWQYRPDSPRKDSKGKPRKYEAQVGRPPVLDVHPFNTATVTDPTVPLWVTEGLKKGDALTTAGVCAVSLSGVYNWRSSLGSLGDWEDIPLKGREVVTCFDADTIEKRAVCQAMRRFGAWLRSKGAKARYLVVPADVNGIAVKGVDDFLAAGARSRS